ncbi:uncharacterized protein B0H64DRAFT_365317 [Chaetomium fimeti]|uniref:NACHT domain-containing protein n=1 Tax=Chaetomium fimeti TaxID=1854472 RepID=A0AAE0H9G7_9PEZI|nr:hypothetical protein B0H64DRAFT_365317 [Chaetomium fimeti]
MSGAEVIGIVAAAGQFIEVTLKVIRLVQEVRSKSRNAPAETQQWIQEIETLKDIATVVQRTAALQTPQIEDILRRCDSHSRSLYAILDAISCETDANFGKKTWAAINGVAQEGKIRALFDDLEREKSSLTVYITAAHLEAAELGGKQLENIQHSLRNISLSQNAPGGCLAELRSSCTDPSDDKRRIEDRKGGLLKDSYKWILDHSEFQRWRGDDQSRLLWIKGDAGKGKTMLLCGIIDEFEAAIGSGPLPDAGLISYFFCEATDPRLRSSTAVLKGLMYLLLDRHGPLTHHLEAKHKRAGKQLFDDANVNTFSALSGVLDNLLRDPALPPTYLLVDALDECRDGLSELLRFIRKTASTATSQVRWVLTSRNWHDIQQELSFEDSRTTLSLELNADHVSRAINVYIHHKVSQLELIRHNQDLQRQIGKELQKKAEGTFLWVALVFQQLLTCKLPSELLPLLETMPPGLEPLYGRMMDEIGKNRDAATCRRILSTATLTRRPLHLLELRTLAAVDETDDMERAVNQCASFLTIRQDNVYLIHQSAKDYLIEHAPKAVFPDGEAGAHRAILLRSLQVMPTSLHRDMYDLRQPGSLIAEVVRPDPDPLNRIRYACVYWIDHFLRSCSWELDGEGVLRFLSTHLLHWLESISLLGVLSDGILSIRRLLREVQAVGPSPRGRAGLSFRNIFGVSVVQTSEPIATMDRLAEFLADALKFVLAHGLVIEQTPLQTYSGALVFSPVNSLIRKQFWNQRLPALQSIWGTEENWDPCLQILQVNNNTSIVSIAFSPDGKTLASGSNDSTIQLWDGVTGRERQTLQGHTHRVQSIAFSPDGKTLASGSDDRTIRLWDAVTGRERQTLKGHTRGVQSIAFSPDGKTLASGSDDRTIRLWDGVTGRERQTLEGHNDWVRSIAFSPDGKTLASGSDDSTIQLWDGVTGRERQTLKGHTRAVRSIAFSPDGKTLVSGSDDFTIRLWDGVTGRERQTLKGHTYGAWSLAFSPDGKTLVSGLLDSTIQLWDGVTGRERQTLGGHTHMVLSMAFSPDGKTLASGSDDSTIRLWDIEVTTSKRVAKGHSSRVTSMAFLPGGGTLLSTATDGTVWKWNVVTGKARRAWRTVSWFLINLCVCRLMTFLDSWEQPGRQCCRLQLQSRPVFARQSDPCSARVGYSKRAGSALASDAIPT